MKLNKELVFSMNEEGADECAKEIDSLPHKFFKSQEHMDEQKTILKELVLDLSAHYGSTEQRTFSISFTESLRKLNVYIKYEGDKYDPRIMNGNKEYGELAESVMSKYPMQASDYQYVDGVNIIHTTVGQKISVTPFQKILISMILGVIMGLVGWQMPDNSRESLLNILSTLKTTLLDLIVMSSTVTVFTMVVNSISDFKSISMVKNAGFGILKYHLVNYFIAFVWSFGFSFHNIRLTSVKEKTDALDTISEFSSLLSDMIPENYVSPLVECNFMHIIIVAFLLGFAMLSVGEGAKPMSQFFRSAEIVSGRIMTWFSGLIPLFLFAMIPSVMWSNSFSLVPDVIRFMIEILLSILFSALIFFIYMCAKTKLPLLDSFKKIFPAMLQGFVTANSALTVPDIQNATKRFGVKDSFNGYATAVGFIFSHVGIMIVEIVLVFGFLSATGAAVSIPQIIRIVVAAFLFSFAVPPTSGGNVAIITIIFEMVGIEDTYLALVAPLLLIADFVETSTRCGEIAMGTVLAAKEMEEME